MPKRDPKEPTFEEAYRQLEDIVRKLEAGGLPLEDSISLYEEGMRLAKLCGDQLDAAELRITRIMADTANAEPVVEEAP